MQVPKISAAKWFVWGVAAIIAVVFFSLGIVVGKWLP